MAAVMPAGPEPTMTTFASIGLPGAACTGVADASSSAGARNVRPIPAREALILGAASSLMAAILAWWEYSMGVCGWRPERGAPRSPVGRAAPRPRIQLDLPRRHGMNRRQDIAAELLDVRDVADIAEAEDDVLDADFRQSLKAVDDLGRRLSRHVHAREVGPLDFIEWPTDLGTALSQHGVLVGQLVRPAEDIAGVRVLGDQTQRLLLAAAADEDLRVRPAQNLR